MGAASEPDESGPENEPRDAAPPPTIEYGKKIEELDGPVLPLLGDKDRTLSYIDEADVPAELRQQARENVKDLWDRIDVKTKTKKQGEGPYKTKTTVYQLQGSVKKANEALQSLATRGMNRGDVGAASGGRNADISSVINSGARVLGGDDNDDDDVSTQWDPTDSHQIMNEFAGKNLDLDDSHCTTLKYAGDDPDNWEYDVTGMPESWEESLDQPGRRWTHAWGPNPLPVPPSMVGSAPSWAKDYMEKAHDASSDYQKYRNMGFALHFLADMGNPMHTGAFLQQINNQWIHYTYEASAERHLMYEGTDSKYANYLINNVDFSLHPDLGPTDYVEVDDPEWYQFFNKWANHAKRLSNISRDYSNEHVQKTYDYGQGADVMEIDKDMETQIEYLFEETMRFMMGYVEEYNGDVSY